MRHALWIMGYPAPLAATREELIPTPTAVRRGVQRPPAQQPLFVTDFPFLSYQGGLDDAVAAAGRVLKDSPAAAVKLEGGEPETIAVVDRLVRSGIPVMGHLGLTPQSVHRFGYRRQANDPISQQRLRRAALDLQAAGCFALVLEHVPAELACSLSAELTLPVIGIGAGDQCDGQVRVTADLLGLTERQPPFSPPLLPGRQLCVDALRGWVDALQDPAAAAPTTAAAPAAPHC